MICVVMILPLLAGMTNAYFEKPTSITFLVPKQKFLMDTSVKAYRISLKATTEISKTAMEAIFTNMSSLIADYKALPYLAIGTTLAIKYRLPIIPGENYLASSKSLYMYLYTFMDTDKELQIQSNCSLIYKLIDNLLLIEGLDFLRSKQEELMGPLTENEVQTDKSKLMQLDNFVIAFNSITSNWYAQIHKIVSEIDNLNSFKFPESLKGRLETVSCLNGTGINFEQINVISSTPGKGGLTIELDVGVPAAMKEMIHLMPISYGGISLKGEADKVIFAKEADSTVVQLLNCSTDLIYVNENAPTCKEIPLEEDCKNGLKIDDIDKILKFCYFSYITPPIAVRLLDDGILILGSDLTVTNYGKTLYQHPPYVLYTTSEVKISTESQELIFPALTTPVTPNILSTRLTMAQILQLQSKAYWDNTIYNLDVNEHLDLLALFIEVIMVPFLAISMCIGIRNKVAQVKSAKQISKKLKKRNQRETRALLRESLL
jgi:hypothetical protein